MRVVLDTNVFISGIFFGGPPSQILEAWRDKRIKLVASAEILDEYRRIGEELSEQFPNINLEPFLGLLIVEAEIVFAPGLPAPICDDSDDDKFLACALAGRCKLIVSGDRLLRKASGYRGIEIITPRRFIEVYLDKL